MSDTVVDRWIVVPRWEEHQHRDSARTFVPAWLKTHTRLLHDDAYLGLTGNRRALLHGLWLEYGLARRCVRLDVHLLNRRLGLHAKMSDYEALNHAGFIEFSASKPASEHDSDPASVEVEVEKNPPTPLRGQRPNQPPKNGGRQLKYLAGARPIWHAHGPDEARVYLDGFTSDLALVEQHLAALELEAAGGSRARIPVP